MGGPGSKTLVGIYGVQLDNEFFQVSQVIWPSKAPQPTYPVLNDDRILRQTLYFNYYHLSGNCYRISMLLFYCFLVAIPLPCITQVTTSNENNSSMKAEINDQLDPNEHNRTYAKEKWFECSIYNKKFIRRGNLKKHNRTHTEKELFECDECAFNHRSNMNQHKRIHSKEKQFECDVCGKKFVERINLKVHNRIHTDEKPSTCNLCGKAFNHRSNMNQHKRIHSKEKPFECDLCGKKFKRHSNLNDHKRIHSEEKPFECDVCGEKPFECDLCGRNFRQHSTLVKHKKRHKNKEQFKCDMCCKFLSLGNLTDRNRTVRAAQERFKCDVCGKVLNKRANLNEHKQIHSNEKLLECDKCDKKFRHRSALSRHKRICTSNEQLKCRKEFSRNNDLLKYERKHKESTETPHRVATIPTDDSQNYTGSSTYAQEESPGHQSYSHMPSRQLPVLKRLRKT
ncbi:hypothetical protein DINM_000833 [Dirofilaria immitis]|nr:hypothetical protein [Dirofilaria immitis]